MAQLILLRHGQSVWNKENRFTGFVDVQLSEQGVLEAKKAGESLRGFVIDHLYASVLKRAIDTALIALEKRNEGSMIIVKNQALNERNYGDLQGLNKDETRRKHGAHQVHVWRRSYDISPPGGESLKDTCDRVIPYFKKEILPKLQNNENVLVVAHGNSLRGLVKELEGLDSKQIVRVEIPTGVPLVYELDSQAKVISKRMLLGETA